MEGENAKGPVVPTAPPSGDRSPTVHARIVSLLDVAVAALDSDGRAIVWNPAATSLFGVSAEQALGRHPSELGLAREPAPVEAAIASVLSSGRATSLDGVAVDGPDGRARHVRLRLLPLVERQTSALNNAALNNAALNDTALNNAASLRAPSIKGTPGALLIATDETEERKRVEQLARQKLAVESLNAALRRQAQALVERHRELEAKNDLVAAASRAKSEFIANMSHELRTPLNSIRGFCRLLLDTRGRVSDTERREFLEIIDRNGEELLALIDDILELTKADAGRLPVQPEPVSVVELASEIVDELKPLAREKGISVRVEVAFGVRPVSTDALRLQRIIRNLAANGIKFTHEGSVILRVRPSDLGGVGIDVIDSGIGVAPEDQGRIWDPFEQVDTSRTRRYGGTGLGLSIVRRLASLLGGSVSLASTPGVGSRFSVELPATIPTAPTHPLAASAATSASHTEARRGASAVLVATSDPTVFRELDRALTEVGLAATWEPLPAETLPRARALDEQRRLAAVIFDFGASLDRSVGASLDRSVGASLVRALEGLQQGAIATRPPAFVLVPAGVEEARLIPGATEVHPRSVDARRLARRIAALLENPASLESTRSPAPVRATAAETPSSLTPSSLMIAALTAAAMTPAASPSVAPTASGPTASGSAASGPAPDGIHGGRPSPARPVERGEGSGRRRRVSERMLPPSPDALVGREILVVEDNEDSARLCQLLLEARGCKVILAPDAGAALAVLHQRSPDAVIMDLMLPGLDGYEATRAIRSMPERAQIPVVAATAAVLPGDKARALEAGCDDIVAKPYDADELVARVAAAIADRSAPAAPPGGGP